MEKKITIKLLTVSKESIDSIILTSLSKQICAPIWFEHNEKSRRKKSYIAPLPSLYRLKCMVCMLNKWTYLLFLWYIYTVATSSEKGNRLPTDTKYSIRIINKLKLKISQILLNYVFHFFIFMLLASTYRIYTHVAYVFPIYFLLQSSKNSQQNTLVS